MEQTETLDNILDGAKAVEVDKDRQVMAVWEGTAGIWFYDTETLEELTMFNATDPDGNYFEYDQVVEHIHELFNDREFSN